jgi:hypothetical protein
MPADQIVSLLIAERDKLTRAIEALRGSVKRRGRPPKTASNSAATPVAPKRAGRKGWTAAKKRAQAKRMRAYWAKRKTKLAKDAKVSRSR